MLYITGYNVLNIRTRVSKKVRRTCIR